MVDNVFKYWPYVALAERWDEDRNYNNKDSRDYIITTLNKWHDDIVNFKEFFIGCDYSYMVETKSEMIFAHLGTMNKQGWRSNFLGWVRTYNKMHYGFGKAAKMTYDRMSYYIKSAAMQKKIVSQSMHSRGGPRGEGLAMLAAINGYKNVRSFSYCPPPAFTKKGVKLFNSLGLKNSTYRILSPGDIVDNVGLFRFYPVGVNVNLLKDDEWILSNMPIAPHSYSSVTANQIALAEELKDQESADYLRERCYVNVN